MIEIDDELWKPSRVNVSCGELYGAAVANIKDHAWTNRKISELLRSGYKIASIEVLLSMKSCLRMKSQHHQLVFRSWSGMASRGRSKTFFGEERRQGGFLISGIESGISHFELWGTIRPDATHADADWLQGGSKEESKGWIIERAKTVNHGCIRWIEGTQWWWRWVRVN